MVLMLALLPPLLALLLLVVAQWSLHDTSWVILAVTIALVSLMPAFHRTPWQITGALGQGVAAMLTACTWLFPACFWSQIQQESGAARIVVRQIACWVPTREAQMLLLVFGFGPCLEVLGGFGFGAIVLFPLLLRLHDNRLKAIQLSLLSQLLFPWGSLGGTPLATGLAGLPAGALSMQAALLLFPETIGAGLLVVQISGGRNALRRFWFLALATGGLFVFLTCLGNQLFGSEVAGVLAGGGVLVLILCWEWRHAARMRTSRRSPLPLVQLVPALLPLIFLLAGLSASRFIPSVSAWLQTQAVVDLPALRFHLALLSGPGLWLLLAALLHFPLFAHHNMLLIRAQSGRGKHIWSIIATLASVGATVALMQESGMRTLLEHSGAALGNGAPWITSLLRTLQGWLVNAPLAGNPWQGMSQSALPALPGSPHSWLLAAQGTSAAIVSLCSPWWVLLLAAIAGLTGKEALIFRRGGVLILWFLALLILVLIWKTASFWPVGLIALLALLGITLPWCSVVAHAETAERCGKRRAAALFLTLRQAERTLRSVCAPARWTGSMLALGSLLLANVLYASYSLVSPGPLSRVDPLLFVCFQMLLLAPVGFVLVYKARRALCRANVSRGLQLGGLLSAELLCYSHALKETGITEAMVFSTINGVLATLLGWKVFGQRISALTRWACLFALGGACLLWFTAPSDWQGDFTALVSGACLTGSAFQIEQLLAEAQQQKQTIPFVLGVQFVTAALLTMVVALCFGQWETMQRFLPSDLTAFVYLSFAAVFLPCVLMLVAQRSVSAITVAFFSVFEPLTGVTVAFFSTGERLPPLAYIGVGIVLIGILLQVAGGTSKQEPAPALSASAFHHLEDT